MPSLYVCACLLLVLLAADRSQANIGNPFTNNDFQTLRANSYDEGKAYLLLSVAGNTSIVGIVMLRSGGCALSSWDNVAYYITYTCSNDDADNVLISLFDVTNGGCGGDAFNTFQVTDGTQYLDNIYGSPNYVRVTCRPTLVSGLSAPILGNYYSQEVAYYGKCNLLTTCAADDPYFSFMAMAFFTNNAPLTTYQYLTATTRTLGFPCNNTQSFCNSSMCTQLTPQIYIRHLDHQVSLSFFISTEKSVFRGDVPLNTWPSKTSERTGVIFIALWFTFLFLLEWYTKVTEHAMYKASQYYNKPPGTTSV